MSVIPNRVPALAAACLIPVMLALGSAGPAWAAAPSAADPARANCIGAGTIFSPVPWPQQLWDLERAWSVSRGAGVTVAVLASGVDAGQQQLSGKVLGGKSFLAGDPPGPLADRDCAGGGTGYASVIAAQPRTGMGFEGLAPSARILPVAVTETDRVTSGSATDSGGGTPQTVAEGLRYAVASGADVVLVACYLTDDVPAVRSAVQAAVASGVVVVAPAGDLAKDGDPVTYPAAYDGVIGVGAMSQDMSLLDTSETGTEVDLVAPGDNVVTSAVGHGHAAGKGTPVAAAFVAAAAALVLSADPRLTPSQVATRLRDTAAPFGTTDPDSVGAGLLDPARAVMESGASGASPVPPGQVTFAAYPAPKHRNGRLAAAGAALGLGGGSVVFAGVLLVRRGRRRHWRPGLPERPAEAEPAEAAEAAVHGLFASEMD